MKRHDFKYAAFQLSSAKDAISPPPSDRSMRLVGYVIKGLIGSVLVLALLNAVEQGLAADLFAVVESVLVALGLALFLWFMTAAEKTVSDCNESGASK